MGIKGGENSKYPLTFQDKGGSIFNGDTLRRHPPEDAVIRKRPPSGKMKEVIHLKSKKLLAALLAAAAALALPAAVFAQEPAEAADAWDGTADTSWYDPDDPQESYTLSTAEEFAGFAELVNEEELTFEGVTVALDADLDLAGHQWIAIGDGNNVSGYFGGTFDGQGHVVRNLTITEPDSGMYGLFGVVSLTGTIQNLGVVDANVATPTAAEWIDMGILAAWVNQSRVINCYTTGTVRSAHGEGGFMLVGGLVGQCTAGAQIIGCYSTATVESLDVGDDSSDTVGGLIGQWENATEESLIADCWFGGKIVCEYTDSGVGGILGANFDFDDDQPGVSIRNCVMATDDVTCEAPDNITWIAALVNGPVENCYWPDDPDYAAVVKLVVDWSQGTASADPDFDETVCGTAAADLTDPAILASLNENAEEGIVWTMGFDHPVFTWDEPNIPADYSAVDAAIGRIPADLSLYTDETVEALEALRDNVDRGMSKAQQAEVDAMAEAIEDAIAALEYKGADYSKVDAAIEAAEALNKDDYEDFTAVQEAVDAVVRGLDITKQAEVDAMAEAIESAIAALNEKSEPETPAVPPETGESSRTGIWFGALLLAAGAAAGTLAFSNRKKRARIGK